LENSGGNPAGRSASQAITIAYRLVGLEGMDEILALQNGRVVERGRLN
jgi:ABC-type transport system involved in Fe-S cluster assembly fused permease/ATPase subunit